jgi:hypothetical protein
MLKIPLIIFQLLHNDLVKFYTGNVQRGCPMNFESVTSVSVGSTWRLPYCFHGTVHYEIVSNFVCYSLQFLFPTVQNIVTSNSQDSSHLFKVSLMPHEQLSQTMSILVFILMSLAACSNSRKSSRMTLVTFNIFVAVTMKMTVFWYMMLCSPC